jgi:pyrroline-5-carboxylate reductase
MPNTPAAIGRGITVACANARVTQQQRQLCDRLLAAIGESAWVEDEALIDTVTAVSGSGPAYVFLLIEALAQAGEAQGLPPALALQLARSTVAGSGELARVSAESPAILRENVTSPGGTTRAALDVLMASDGLQPLIARAVFAAAARSRALAS